MALRDVLSSLTVIACATLLPVRQEVTAKQRWYHHLHSVGGEAPARVSSKLFSSCFTAHHATLEKAVLFSNWSIPSYSMACRSLIFGKASVSVSAVLFFFALVAVVIVITGCRKPCESRPACLLLLFGGDTDLTSTRSISRRRHALEKWNTITPQSMATAAFR